MEKKEILDELTRISSIDSISTERKVFGKLKNDFNSIVKREEKELEEKQLDLEEEITVDEEAVKLNEEIQNLVTTIESKIKAEADAKVAEEKENLTAKEVLLKRFQLLMQNEENIGTLFNTIKEIREEWKEVGNIPKVKFQEIQNQYSQLNELFNYNVNIYKELKENDLKKNFSLKNQIVHQVKELLEEPKIKQVERQIRVIQAEWEEVGPTFTEHWEKLKEDYWTSVKAVYEKIKTYYVAQEESREVNLEKKKTLIEEVKAAVTEFPSDHKGWEAATEQMAKFQAKWKNIGYAPKAVNDEIWKTFREMFDVFYEKKSEYYQSRNEEQGEKKSAKKSIIDAADKLKEITNWKEGTELAIRLQKEWKNVGHAGGHAEQKLWKEFRQKCDAFFEKKDAHFKQMDEANEVNLEAKKALIEEVKAFKAGEDNKETIASLKEFSKRFAEIGNVPFKLKDTIYDEYKAALDEQYDKIKMSSSDKDKMLFQAKIDMIKGSKNPIAAIQKEKDFIRKQITNLTKEVTNFENNLGFFGNSKGADALLKGVRDNIQKGKDQIDKLKRKLQDLTKTEKQQEANEAE
ncbi:MAG: hypothetical protein ACI8Q1_002188 [Parvicella sp.]|jgi:hypothetical protein